MKKLFEANGIIFKRRKEMDEKTFEKVQQIMREVDTYENVLHSMMMDQIKDITIKFNETAKAREIIYKRIAEILEEDK
jgi:hypothetical protein